jgi:hypothetical protein
MAADRQRWWEDHAPPMGDERCGPDDAGTLTADQEAWWSLQAPVASTCVQAEEFTVVNRQNAYGVPFNAAYFVSDPGDYSSFEVKRQSEADSAYGPTVTLADAEKNQTITLSIRGTAGTATLVKNPAIFVNLTGTLGITLFDSLASPVVGGIVRVCNIGNEGVTDGSGVAQVALPVGSYTAYCWDPLNQTERGTQTFAIASDGDSQNFTVLMAAPFIAAPCNAHA